MATDCRVLLEDGSSLLLENDSNLLLDNCTPSGGGGGDTGCDLLLEDGSLLLQEDGSSAFLVENCTGTVSVVTPSGGTFLIPKGFAVPLFEEEPELASAVLALMRRRRWRIVG